VSTGMRCSRKVCGWAVAGLMVVSVTGCRSTAMTSPATPSVVIATPTIATPLPPSVPGLSTDEVASLDSLARLDAYPLFTMHLYGAGRESSSLPAVIRTEPSVWACSLFAALGDADHRLFGRNFDWSYSPALLLFNHPDDGYDSVSMVDLAYFFDAAEVRGLVDASLKDRRALLETPGWPFDGLNEAGLAVGMAAVPESPLPRDPSLPTIGSLGIIREMLDHAGTVDEAVTLMRGYNVDMEGGPAIHYLIADAAGRAALVELFGGEVSVIPNEGPWHLATNHYRTPLREGETGGCSRYAKLDTVLTATSGTLCVADALALLTDVDQSSTQWSIVYDMSAREIHVSMGRAYAQVHNVALRKE
jgi:hypothetical protein